MSFKNHMEVSQCQLPVISVVYILPQYKPCLIQKKTQVIIFSSLEHEICCKHFFHYAVCCFITWQCWIEVFLYYNFNDIPSWCMLSN